MKRIIALLLAVIMVFALCACGGNDNENTASDSKAKTDTEKDVEEEFEFKPLVLVDNEYCKFTVKSAEESGGMFVLKVELENKSDVNEMFGVDNAAVNGWLSDPFWAETVAAGMKANSEIEWNMDVLEEYGIKEVSAISFVLSVYDDDDWSVDNFVEEEFAVYPTGNEKFKPEIRKTQSGDTVLVDTDDFCAVLTSVDPDGFWGYTLNLYVYNKTDKELMFSADDVSVNDYMCDPCWCISVPAGMQTINGISWFEDDFEENGITDVEKITMTFTAYDNNNWDDIYAEEIVINP